MKIKMGKENFRFLNKCLDPCSCRCGSKTGTIFLSNTDPGFSENRWTSVWIRVNFIADPELEPEPYLYVTQIRAFPRIKTTPDEFLVVNARFFAMDLPNQGLQKAQGKAPQPWWWTKEFQSFQVFFFLSKFFSSLSVMLGPLYPAAGSAFLMGFHAWTNHTLPCKIGSKSEEHGLHSCKAPVAEFKILYVS